MPNHAKVNDEIVLRGEGFGANQGTVAFGSASASVLSWSDKEVKVKVPTGVSGKMTITVSPPGGTALASDPAAFSID